jgi:hypothetical protein
MRFPQITAIGESSRLAPLRRLRIESLEERHLLAVFTVTNSDDAGPGSLRQTILDANEALNLDVLTPDRIEFEIPGDGPHTIQPLSPLPPVTDPLVIDGYTQPGARPNTQPTGMGLNAVLLVALDGSLAGEGSALVLLAGNSAVRGLAVHSFSSFGEESGTIVIAAQGGNTIEGNYLGTDTSGACPMPNFGTAVLVAPGADSNVIGADGDGTADAAQRNLIAASDTGIELRSNGNTVAGNLIGTDVSGTMSFGNGLGILITGQFNRIGTDGDGVADEAEGNLISGNSFHGIQILGPDPGGGPFPPIVGPHQEDGEHEPVGSDNVVAGNFVGVDVTGAAALPNFGTGIAIRSGSHNRIGTDGNAVADDAERNVISANFGPGVEIRGSDNLVAGNLIGTDATGSTGLGNETGVLIAGQRNRIGTDGNGLADAAERNVISANSFSGVDIGGRPHGAFQAIIAANRLAQEVPQRDDNVVAGNYIGTNITGTLALGNRLMGVAINSSPGNRIGAGGGLPAAEGNLISGNLTGGLSIAADHTLVAGNFIGTDATGRAALGNGFGVQVSGAFNLIGTNGDGITDRAEANLIAGNLSDGVLLIGEGPGGPAPAVVASQNGDEPPGDDELMIVFAGGRNIVAGNLIGTDATGQAALGNAGHGVSVVGFTGIQTVFIEVERIVEREVEVCDELGCRIEIVTERIIELVPFTALTIAGAQNRIGTDGNGIGDEAERNVISANAGSGVEIDGAEQTVVAGNHIGVDVAGTAPLGNGMIGVSISRGRLNRIGTDGDGLADAAERNVISANASDGVRIFSDVFDEGEPPDDPLPVPPVQGASLEEPPQPPGDRNLVAGNSIGTDATGVLELGNGGSGVLLFGFGAAANQIGGSAELGNTIAFNARDGVGVRDAATGNQVRGNAVHSNGGLGIDLGGEVMREEFVETVTRLVAEERLEIVEVVICDRVEFRLRRVVILREVQQQRLAIRVIDTGGDGVTLNDELDDDLGPNHGQNFPLLSRAEAVAGTRVAGQLNGRPEDTFRLDFYASTAADPSGFGEGERYLGTAEVTTDGSGFGRFDLLLPVKTRPGALVTATATDEEGNTSEFSPAVEVVPVRLLVTGADAGGGPHVRVFDAHSGRERFSFFAYHPLFAGGVRVAAADVNGDDVPDIITAAGPGGGPHVRVFDGLSGQQLAGPVGSFFAYEPRFRGGVFVAAADFNADGRADIVTGAGEGGIPHVRVFSGLDGSELARLFVDDNIRSGVRVAAGDVDGDGTPDIITAPGPGVPPLVQVYDGLTGLTLPGSAGRFLAYHPHFRGGVYVAAADLNGDGRADVITGAGAGGGPHVRAFSGLDGAELASVYAYDPLFRGGVRVGAGDLNRDGRPEIITGAGPGGGPHVRVLAAGGGSELQSLYAYDPLFAGGLFVAGGQAGMSSAALRGQAHGPLPLPPQLDLADLILAVAMTSQEQPHHRRLASLDEVFASQQWD